jgi:SNF2 family DNA or RNA helicase
VRELQRFAPTLKVVEYAGPDRSLASLGPNQVVVCSYALLQQDHAELREVEFATAVLDEAQFIKNAESLRARAAFGLQARQRFVATGTPVENHYGDLWSIFHFLNPGLLGDWAPFKRRFVHPKESGSSDGGDAPEIALRRLIHPYVLRRRKSEVLKELPPLTEVQHDVHLSSDDGLRYAYLRKEIHEKLFTAWGKKQNKLEVLAEIGRLRRFCCHPRLVFPDAPAESAKVDALLSLVEELRENGHRALVFSQYVDFLALVREQLDERLIRYEYLDGSTPNAQRQVRVDAFQNGDAPLFLISLKAGGFGLNLTAADYVIHLDPWWNPAVEAQATDRAHRIGQERRVTVYRLVTKNTIEEQIVQLHGKKQKLARALLDDQVRAGPDVDELVSLIG